jgi:hypothetical protein
MSVISLAQWLFSNCTTAPSLGLLVHSGFLIRYKLAQVYHHHPCSFPRAMLWMSLLSFQGADPSTISSHSLFTARRKTWLLALWPPVWESPRWSCWIPSPFLDVAAVLHLGPLFPCCIPGQSIISSQPSVLYDCGPHAVQEWYSGSSIFGRRPTSSRTHHCPGSVSSAVDVTDRLDDGPHIGHPMLW